MTPLVATSTTVLSVLTVLAGSGTLVLFGMFFVARKNAQLSGAVVWIGKHAPFIGFVITFGSLMASFFYSEIAGFPPCVLCWIARALLLPQLLLFLTLLKGGNTQKVVWWSIMLSLGGALLMVYQTYLQFGGTELVNCAAVGASCGKRYFLEFGYVTIPTMALTMFLALIALVLMAKKTRLAD